MADIVDLWNRIKAYCEDRGLDNCSNLNPPATASAIQAAEGQLGITLPDDYKAVLLENNGEDSDKSWSLFTDLESETECFDEFETLLPIENVVEEWEDWRDIGEDMNEDFIENAADFREYIDDAIQVMGFHDQWIPIIPVANGDVVCLDLAPTENGTPGQVILVAHDQERRAVIAESFYAFLECYIDALK